MNPRRGESASHETSLRRELGTWSATWLGLGSILGTGVFVSLGLVAGLAGIWTAAAVVLAALVAACNALSSAQLAAAHPRSGGTYEYGYELLNPLAGFTAGWMFLCAKSASGATAALGFAGYALNAAGVEAGGPRLWLAGAAVIALTVLVAGGLRRSNLTNTVIVSITLLALCAFVVSGLPSAVRNWGALPKGLPSLSAFLEAVALMFVAYTGYGRVATLGEEVRDPRRTIPRAILSTLVVSAALYFAVAAVGVSAVGGAGLLRATEGQSATLEIAARTFGVPGVAHLVAVGAITAMLGVLLNLLLGLSRVLLAMGRRGDMPHAVTRMREANASPYAAVLVVGAVVLLLTLIGSVKTAWSFSAFTVLVYYAITNVAALRLPPQRRFYPRLWSVGGLLGCLFLAFWVERPVWLAGCGVLAVGWLWHTAAARLSR
jgi:APA family basic amino acid/polyamine antiporter